MWFQEQGRPKHSSRLHLKLRGVQSYLLLHLRCMLLLLLKSMLLLLLQSKLRLLKLLQVLLLRLLRLQDGLKQLLLHLLRCRKLGQQPWMLPADWHSIWHVALFSWIPAHPGLSTQAATCLTTHAGTLIVAIRQEAAKGCAQIHLVNRRELLSCCRGCWHGLWLGTCGRAMQHWCCLCC